MNNDTSDAWKCMRTKEILQDIEEKGKITCIQHIIAFVSEKFHHNLFVELKRFLPCNLRICRNIPFGQRNLVVPCANMV
jgi:hypothetical protein